VILFSTSVCPAFDPLIIAFEVIAFEDEVKLCDRNVTTSSNPSSYRQAIKQ